MTWFQIWTVCWQVAVVITPIMLAAVILWLKSQFVSKTDATAERNRIDAALAAATVKADTRHEFLKDKTTDHEARLNAVEKDVAKPPSRHQLNNTVSVLQGEVRVLAKAIEGLGDQFKIQVDDMRKQGETTNTYLHTLIERGLGTPK